MKKPLIHLGTSKYQELASKRTGIEAGQIQVANATVFRRPHAELKNLVKKLFFSQGG